MTRITDANSLGLIRLIHYIKALRMTSMRSADIANHAYIFALELRLAEYTQKLRVGQEISHDDVLVARWKAADLLKEAEEQMREELLG